MDHRERVLTAIAREEADRVPVDMGSVGGLIVDPAYFSVLDLLGLDRSVAPYRNGSTANYYDERLLEIFDVDFRHVWLTSPDKPKNVRHPDGTVTDMWGITWSAEGSYPVVFPLKGKSEREILDYKWPVLKDWNTDDLKERARRYYEETDYAVVAKAVFDGSGFMERCYCMRSIDDFFIDMIENEDLVRFMVDKFCENEIQMWDMYLDAVGPYIHITQRLSDLGTQTGLFISPEHYRKYFKPADDKVYRFIKSKAPHVKIWFHACGAIEPLIGDFIDLGVDILNPVQPLCFGMESEKIKAKYGDRLCFHGGIDLQRAMPGSLEDVREEVKRRISAFAPGGGYILAAANHIQKDTPAENIVGLYRFAKEYGQYPLTD